MKRTALIGTAGSGKTTALQALYNDFRREKKSVLFLSYTRSAALEFAQREFNAENVLKDITTLHSFTLRLLLSSNIFDDSHVKKLAHAEKLRALVAKKFGLKYSLNAFTPAHGNKVFNEIDSIIHTYAHKYDKEELAELFKDDLTKKIFLDYEAAKERAGLIDFNDILIEFLAVGHTEDYDVIIVDEAQDLSNLQHAVVDLLAKNAEKVVYAGDVFQSLYFESGANPFAFVQKADSIMHLKYTYRLPRLIFEFAKEHAEKTIKKYGLPEVLEIKAKTVKKEEGVIDVRLGIENALVDAVKEAAEGKSVYVITRTNYMSLKILEMLKNAGIIAGSLKRDFATHGLKKLHEILKVVNKVKKDKKGFTRSDLNIIKKYGKQEVKALIDKLELKAPAGGVISYEDLERAFMLKKIEEEGIKTLDVFSVEAMLKTLDPLELFDLSEDEKKILNNAIDLSNKLKVDTIHASKGREADSVYLINAAKTTKQNLQEAFVFFVAITRAREKLTIVIPEKEKNSTLKPFYVM